MCLKSEAETTRLAAAMAPQLGAGDTVLLGGPIGSGKSVFARGLLRAKGVTEDIPSPTFTLAQVYSVAGLDIWHCDLYRLRAPDEVIELGLDEAFQTAFCVVEWPDILMGFAPVDALWVRLAAGDAAHWLEMTTADAALGARIEAAIG